MPLALQTRRLHLRPKWTPPTCRFRMRTWRSRRAATTSSSGPALRLRSVSGSVKARRKTGTGSAPGSAITNTNGSPTRNFYLDLPKESSLITFRNSVGAAPPATSRRALNEYMIMQCHRIHPHHTLNCFKKNLIDHERMDTMEMHSLDIVNPNWKTLWLYPLDRLMRKRNSAITKLIYVSEAEREAK